MKNENLFFKKFLFFYEKIKFYFFRKNNENLRTYEITVTASPKICVSFSFQEDFLLKCCVAPTLVHNQQYI